MKRKMTRRQLMTAYRSIDRQINALYKRQAALDDEAQKMCPLKVGQLIEFSTTEFRKRWGIVTETVGTVKPARCGWGVWVTNTRRNGQRIGGRFYLRESVPFKIVPRPEPVTP